MREQGKVQTIAIDGRPLNEPMQGVCGSKGSQKLAMNTLQQFAMDTIEVAKDLDGEYVAKKINDTTAAGRIYNATQLSKRSFVTSDGKYPNGGVNSLNNQRMNDTSNTPLEFIYEAADCKLFYTVATFFDVEKLWKAAVDAKWFDGKCVAGSTGHKTAIGVVENKPGFGQMPKNNSSGASELSTSAASLIGAPDLLMGSIAVAAIMVAL
jgi:hypothetical protein